MSRRPIDKAILSLSSVVARRKGWESKTKDMSGVLLWFQMSVRGLLQRNVERGAIVLRLKSFVDPMKDEVHCPVLTLSILPSIDNSLVVTEDPKVPWSIGVVVVEDDKDEQLKTNAFSPPDVSLPIESSPVPAERPCPPIPIDNNCNAEGCDCIAKGVDVDKPPVEVIINVFDGMMWHERTIGTDCKHGFQYGETGMKQFAIQSLNVE
ncbi:hypothetical protein BDR04DRAFT_1121138 [Suillus decipiens]|nr:hypothetical protein BDR04DRAFT_1121138 [Suillus decipiens]